MPGGGKCWSGQSGQVLGVSRYLPPPGSGTPALLTLGELLKEKQLLKECL